MDKKELVERIINDDNIKLQTVEELQDLLDMEMSKSNPDYDLVNELSLSIIEARGQKPLDNVDINEKLREFQKVRKEKIKLHMPKWAYGLAAACLILTFGNIYTVSAWNMNVFSFIVELTDGGTLINFNKHKSETVLTTSENDPYGIIALCEKNGINNIETPHYIPNDYILTDIETRNSEDSYVRITYKNDNNTICFVFESYYNENFCIPSDTHNLSETVICGHKALISKEDNQMIAVFSTENFMCTMMTKNVDYNECDKILEEMR